MLSTEYEVIFNESRKPKSASNTYPHKRWITINCKIFEANQRIWKADLASVEEAYCDASARMGASGIMNFARPAPLDEPFTRMTIPVGVWFDVLRPLNCKSF